MCTKAGTNGIWIMCNLLFQNDFPTASFYFDETGSWPSCHPALVFVRLMSLPERLTANYRFHLVAVGTVGPVALYTRIYDIILSDFSLSQRKGTLVYKRKRPAWSQSLSGGVQKLRVGRV